MDEPTKIRVLEGTLDVLGPNGGNWIQDAYRLKDRTGFCISGAAAEAAIRLGVVTVDKDEFDDDVYDVDDDNQYQDFGELADYLVDEVSLSALAQEKGFGNVPKFNDESDRSFREVQDFIKMRIAQLQGVPDDS